MKKLLWIVPLLVISCQKEKPVEKNAQQDSLSAVLDSAPAKAVDSAAVRDSVINNAPATKKVLAKGVMRDTDNGRIVREADASELPFTIGDAFTGDNEQLILKIHHYPGSEFSASVTPENKMMNIRINQIKSPDGSYDGPFGRTVSGYPLRGKGSEVWLIIGKSNMASGDATGSFKVTVE